MMVHLDRERWVVRCDGRLEDGSQCPATAEGKTVEEAAAAAREKGMALLAGGRWACPDTAKHKRGVM